MISKEESKAKIIESFLKNVVGRFPESDNLIKNHNLMNKYFLIRNLHKTKKQLETFEKVYLLPVHFKISKKKYQLFIEILKKSL